MGQRGNVKDMMYVGTQDPFDPDGWPKSDESTQLSSLVSMAVTDLALLKNVVDTGPNSTYYVFNLVALSTALVVLIIIMVLNTINERSKQSIKYSRSSPWCPWSCKRVVSPIDYDDKTKLIAEQHEESNPDQKVDAVYISCCPCSSYQNKETSSQTNNENASTEDVLTHQSDQVKKDETRNVNANINKDDQRRNIQKEKNKKKVQKRSIRIQKSIRYMFNWISICSLVITALDVAG